eukprot:PITA_12114
MLYDQDLPRFIWVEACNTTVYIQNRTPRRALGKKMLEQIFTEKKREVSHLRIFGSVAYCHIPDENHSKLDQIAKKGYLVGYSKTSKAYTIYVPGSRKIVVRQDIEPPTTSGRTSREVRQTLKDAEEFVRAPRIDKRQYRQPDRYQALVAQFAEPSSFQEAAQHQVWVDAMVEEYSSIMTNDVWEVVSRPEDRSVVGSRWIYKIKYVVDGSVEKYKVGFVANGYEQKEGIDYEETFAPVSRYASIRSIISLAT